MKIWTYAAAKEKVLGDLNLEDEDFISESELLGYFNEAIDEAEAMIHTLYEDYFLTSEALPMVEGVSSVDVPEDIYALKIRHIAYANGGKKYEIKPIRRLKQLADIQADDDYRYLIKNSKVDGYKIVFYPEPRETSANNATIWYLRNAAEVTEDSDEIDIPEGINFIFQRVKCACRAKENGGSVPAGDAQALEQQRQLLVETLTGMKPDENNEAEMDLSFYADFDSSGMEG